MSAFFLQIFSFLANPPGNFIYHIILAFTLAVVLQAEVNNWHISGYPQAKRMIIGLTILVGLQFLVFGVGLICWMAGISTLAFLPALDRAVSLISTILLIWLWVYPEPDKLADLSAIGLSLFSFFLMGISSIFYPKGFIGDFNSSPWEIVWQGISIALILLGVFLSIRRRPEGWGSALSMLILAFLGHLSALIWHGEGNYPGPIRLADLAMFPVLLTLAHRYSVFEKGASQKKLFKESETDRLVWEERRKFSADAKTFHVLMELASETSVDHIIQSLTESVARAMLADVCSFIIKGDQDNLIFVSSYDLIREERLVGKIMEKESVPLLSEAITRSRTLLLPASETSLDISSLGNTFNYNSSGSVLYAPIKSTEKKSKGGILLLSPYTSRQWNNDDLSYLVGVSPFILPIIERMDEIAILERDRDEARIELQREHERMLDLQKKTIEAPMSAGQDIKLVAQNKIQAEMLASMTAMRDEAQKKIDQLYRDMEQLRIENEDLRNFNAKPAKDEESAAENPQMLEQTAVIHPRFIAADNSIKESETSLPGSINEPFDVVSSITDALIQAMSTFTGNIDLLHGESIGALGPLQRKFVNRIKVSCEQINNLVNDMIQIINIDRGQVDISQSPLDLNLIVESALGLTGTLLREKNLSIQLDIPEIPPEIRINRNALTQILIHLLQNAVTATPPEGSITLRIRLEEVETSQRLSIQMIDSGGGIKENDLPRIFERRIQSENSSIEGVGDKSVGLSIVKSLVDAQYGRIWIETHADVGSTFCVLLPVCDVETKS